MTGRFEILQEIIEGVDALAVPADVLEQFKRLVRRTGAAHGISGMANAERVEYARRLVRAGISRATVRDRLMATHGISRRQAYVVIGAAINCAD